MSCANSKIVWKRRAMLLSSVLDLWYCSESVRSGTELPVWTDWWKRSAICSNILAMWQSACGWKAMQMTARCGPSRCLLQLLYFDSYREAELQYSFTCCFMLVFVYFCVCLNLAAHPPNFPCQLISVWQEPAVTEFSWALRVQSLTSAALNRHKALWLLCPPLLRPAEMVRGNGGEVREAEPWKTNEFKTAGDEKLSS